MSGVKKRILCDRGQYALSRVMVVFRTGFTNTSRPLLHISALTFPTRWRQTGTRGSNDPVRRTPCGNNGSSTICTWGSCTRSTATWMSTLAGKKTVFVLIAGKRDCTSLSKDQKIYVVCWPSGRKNMSDFLRTLSACTGTGRLWAINYTRMYSAKWVTSFIQIKPKRCLKSNERRTLWLPVYHRHRPTKCISKTFVVMNFT